MNRFRTDKKLKHRLVAALLCFGLALPLSGQATEDAPLDFINGLIAAHPGQSGAYILDTGMEALLARAWLADHAQHTIEVQYFIWSTDNIGTLATEACCAPPSAACGCA